MINTKKLLYFAYGTNLNKKIFLKKYKNAKYLSKHILKGFELVLDQNIEYQIYKEKRVPV